MEEELSRLEKADCALQDTSQHHLGHPMWLNLMDIARTQAMIAQAEAQEQTNELLRSIATSLEKIANPLVCSDPSEIILEEEGLGVK